MIVTEAGVHSISLRESMLVMGDKANMQATLDGNHSLNTSILHQRPDAVYHEPLKMIACEVSINSFLISINLPQRKDVRSFVASADVVLEDARLFA